MRSVETKQARSWLPFLLIIVASALAHLWCLRSQFYMDDMNQIRDSELVLLEKLLPLNLNSWTQGWYIVQHRLFGMSSVGFHAGNWLLHTAVACTLFGFGRDFLRENHPEGVALFGGLLFAVHPLTSEIPNYARTQDLAWVTLFSLLAAWAVLRYLRQDDWKLAQGADGQITVLSRTNCWRKLLYCALTVAGATFSKGPGFFHAALAVSVVALVSIAQNNTKGFQLLRKQSLGALLGIFAAVIAAMWATGMLDSLLGATGRWQEPRFIGHAYTLSRVFWEFAWRSVIPVSLSSDHLITETLIPPGTPFWNIPDKGAMLAMAGLFGLAALSIFLITRKSTRFFGACLFVYAATILLRFLFLVTEFMPEYRIYPGLPWFCLGAAMLLAGGWKYLFEAIPPRIPAMLLLAVFAFLSAKRSFVWHDLEGLATDVLKQYPARARALWTLHDLDAEKQNWQAIIDRHATLWPEVERQFVKGNQLLAPTREIPSGDFVFAMVAIHGYYARAIAHTQNPTAGLRVMAMLEAHMRRMKMTPEDKPSEWGYFYRDKALILEQAGKFKEAAELLHRKEVASSWFWWQDIERVDKKLKPGL